MKVDEAQTPHSPVLNSERQSVDAATRPQLVHSTRQMFEARIAKYIDPHNLEWDWNDVTDKWQRHAFNAYIDLVETEKRLSTVVAAVQRALAIEDSVTQGQEKELREGYREMLVNAISLADRKETK